MTLLSIIISVLTLRPVDACWTFVGRPTCEQQLDIWTCCDGEACFTFETAPTCEPSWEAFVCCG